MLAAGPCVLLTRALKADGAPTLPSRWLQRMEQLTHGLDLARALIPEQDYAAIAARMMEVTRADPVRRPAPTPPVAVRPRKLSVTEIETWLRDPYAIYAKHVLKLRPLDPLDVPIGPRERGTALHKALEIFIRDVKGESPPNALDQLIAVADDVFTQAGIPRAALALWRPRFLAAARGFIAFERERRAAIATSHLEIKGTLPIGAFTLSGIADRIDLLTNGDAAILDYKTGAAPSKKQVENLLSPQLPLEAAILAGGGFGEIGSRATQDLIYLSLSSEKSARTPRYIEGDYLPKRAVDALQRRIAWFAEKDTPYRSRVRPYRADIAGDYDHLARVREWSPSGWTEEE